MNGLGGLSTPTGRLLALVLLAVPLGFAGVAASNHASVVATCGAVETVAPLAAAAPGIPAPGGIVPLTPLGPAGVPVLPASPPIPPTALCMGKIRPGAAMQPVSTAGVPVVGHCTFNYLWSGSDGRKYVGTAAHCVSTVGQSVAVYGLANPVGVVAYRLAVPTGSPQPPDDFALIRIDVEDENKIDPSVCHWGGPTGTYADTGGAALATRQYGWGTGWAATPQTRPRPGFLLTATSASWEAATTTLPGDSGSPLMLADGRAVGLVTHIGTFPETARTLGPRLTYVEGKAETALGITLDLMTAPLA